MSLLSSGLFVLTVLLAEALGVAVVVLMLVLLLGMGGLSLNVEETGLFNLHPFLMTLGLAFLYGNAIMVYKAGAGTGLSKFTLKMIHFILQLLAFILSVLGLIAVFQYHRVHGYPQMMSLHNWVGMATVVFFGLQILFGFLFFLYPRPKESIRVAYKNVHLFFGYFIFGMVAVSILTGLTEHMLFNGGFEAFTTNVLLANFFALILVAFMGVVTFAVTSPFFHKSDVAEENPAQGTADEKSSLLEMKDG